MKSMKSVLRGMILFVMAELGFTSVASDADVYWTGGGPDNKWSTAENRA